MVRKVEVDCVRLLVDTLIQILCSSFTTRFVISPVLLKTGLTYLVCRQLIRFGMIGNGETRATQTRSQGAPSAGRSVLMCPSSSIPPGVLLGSTYVASLRLVRVGTNVQQLSSVIPGDGLWEDITIGDVMDTVGGRFCYTYD